jgi:D-glycero-D-manno-heptose 1,7-bisphosphate phosphatase
VVNRAVFLDRDGVLNANVLRDGKPVAPTTLDRFELLDGAADAVQRLKAAGFLTIVVTNQPDVATGRNTRETIAAMHATLQAQMPLDAIKVCFHVDADNCDCRKPKPGMLRDAAATFGIDLNASFMVGDRWRDVAAGQSAGCVTVFVDGGHEQEQPFHADKVVKSLAEAATYIIGTSSRAH